jgi:hypothetical protein
MTELLAVLIAMVQGGLDNLAKDGLESVQYALGLPDGNILFTGNQIRQGDAGERGTIVTLFTLDDANFSDNQIEVLNGDEIRATAIVLGSTVRAAHNRMKEPIFPALREALSGSDAQIVSRYSLATLNFALGNMSDNQGNYCFVTLGNAVRMRDNLSALEAFLKCGEQQLDIPPQVNAIFILLLALSSRFIQSVYQTELRKA